MTTYIDKVTCPEGHTHQKRRRMASAGFKVATYCPWCERSHNIMAGPAPAGTPKPGRKMTERDIEARLVKRALELGGEVRKVQWVGRNSAPDRLVMLPSIENMRSVDQPAQTIWIELKAPGLAATFPKNAHERAQQREHERMRRMGQRVEVVDSYERIEEILK